MRQVYEYFKCHDSNNVTARMVKIVFEYSYYLFSLFVAQRQIREHSCNVPLYLLLIRPFGDFDEFFLV